MMVMPIDLARKILGYADDEVSDITFNVPNPDEWYMMTDKVSALHYDLRVVNKNDVQKSYENLYNYKGGLFLILFLVVTAYLYSNTLSALQHGILNRETTYRLTSCFGLEY